MSTIVIVDDHELLAQSLSFALQARGLEASALRLTKLETARAQLLAQRPDVVLLDLQLGPVGHGQRLVRPLTAAGVRVLVVSGVTDDCEIAATIEAGAVGFVAKREPFEVLVDAATRVAQGQPVMTAEERHRLLGILRRQREEAAAARVPFDRLSPKEKEVLEALCNGDSVTSIATRGVVSVATVRAQVRAIHLKLGVASQLEAVALAHRYHWFEGASRVQRSA